MTRSILLAGSMLLAIAAASPAARADNPREFLSQALEGDNSEIMLGRLAAERARSPAVRQYGQTLANDHAQARDQVLDVGRRFGIGPNREPSAEARDEREQLIRLSGRRAFDREFIRFMIDDHRRDIGEFRDEARENHGQVSDLARSQLPTLRSHLRTAMELQRNDPRYGDGGADMPRDRGDRAYDNGRYQDNNANRDFDAQNNSRSYDNQRYDGQRNRGDTPDR